MPSPTKKRRNRASLVSVRRRTNRKSKTRNTKKKSNKSKSMTGGQRDNNRSRKYFIRPPLN